MHGNYEKRVHIYLDLDDHRQLVAAADAHGMPLTPYARDAALAYSDQRFLVPPRLDELLSRLIQETRRVGNNVNQIAARVNVTRTVRNDELDQAKFTISHLEQTTRILNTVIHNLRHDHQVIKPQNDEFHSDAGLHQRSEKEGTGIDPQS